MNSSEVSSLELVRCSLNEAEQRFEFELADGWCTAVSVEHAMRNKILQTALATGTFGETQFSWPVNSSVLKIWVAACVQWTWPPVHLQLDPSLADRLKAADYFGDDELLGQLCSGITQSMEAQHSLHTNWPDPAQDVELASNLKDVEDAGDEHPFLQTLQAIPDHLAVRVLRHTPNSLGENIMLLPAHMHHLAVHASRPSLMTDSSLTLDWNQRHYSTATAVAILKCFSMVPSASELAIISTKHPAVFSRHYQADFKKSLQEIVPSKLHSLRLENMQLGETLVHSLHRLTQLTSLKFANVDFNATVETMGRTFRGLTSLRELALVSIFRETAGLDDWKSLMNSLTRLEDLQVFNLSSNLIKGEGALSLSQIILSYSKLQHLNVSRNNIDGNGALALSNAIHHLNLLEHVDLSRNSIDNKGAEAMAQAIRSLPQLQYLDVSWNTIESDGVKALAREMATDTRLKHLDVSWNPFDTVSALQLADSMANHPQLCFLNLSPGATDSAVIRLRRRAVVLLAQRLQCLKGLEYLNIHGWPISTNAAASALLELVSSLTRLRVLKASIYLLAGPHTALIQHLLELSPNLTINP